MSSVCVCALFWTFHDRITFERIELEGCNLLQSTPNVKLLLGRHRHYLSDYYFSLYKSNFKHCFTVFRNWLTNSELANGINPSELHQPIRELS